MPAISPEQCRAARALLDWTQEDLAERAEVSRSTIREFERGHHALNKASAAMVVAAVQAAGVLLLSGDGMGPGARLAAGPGSGG